MLRRIRFQPDYFMSAQFAGVAVALRNGAYARKGLEVEVLPLGRAGEHAEEISIVAKSEDLIVGSTEQNILIPELRKHGAAVKAVSAMFGASPLAFAALPGRQPWQGGGRMRLGVHDDTISLAQRLLPQAEVVGVGRVDKMQLLVDGQLDAIQVYDVMETLKLEHDLGASPAILPVEGLAGARLGYAQVLFASDGSLADPQKRQQLHAFLDATFDGWASAARDPSAAARDVMALMPQQTDHWVDTLEFHTASVTRCCDYVRRARCAGILGAIDPLRWAEATEWLGGSGGRPSLDSSLWGPDPLLADGDSLAARMLQHVSARAAAVTSARGGQPPTLGLVTVGHTALGHTSPGASAREDAAPGGQSWFNKAEAGARRGVRVEQHDLPAATSTVELCNVLRRLTRTCDGIQLMWPLPAHIDSEVAYAAVPRALDVDGAHYVGASELRGSSGASELLGGSGKRASLGGGGGDANAGHAIDGSATAEACWLPVTPAAVLELLAARGVALAGKRVVVVGRSRIVGSPLAHAFLQSHATVSVAHRHTSALDELCRAADIVVSCAGVPGLIRSDWIAPGAAVLSVGSTYCTQSASLRSDLDGGVDAFKHASLVASAPGGVGPLSLAILLRHVVEAAEARVAAGRGAALVGADDATPAASAIELADFLTAAPGWSLRTFQEGGGAAMVDGGSESSLAPPQRALVRHLPLESHQDAAQLLHAAGVLGDRQDHHIAHAAVEHRCAEGVQLVMHAYTTSTGDVTAHDLNLAREIEALYRRTMGVDTADDASAAAAAFRRA